MLVQKDYEDLLKLFNANKVKFVVIGAFALAFHNRPRYTKDIDILVEPTLKNGEKIVAALTKFGFGDLDLEADDFATVGRIVQLGFEPVRIDIVNSISGTTFENVWKTKKAGKYGSQKVYFIGLNEFIKNKKHSGRVQDKADLELLKNDKKR